jgi:GT2 family glycosyltransferase
MNNCAPVLFLVFNRPEHTEKSLSRIREIRPTRLYVHCDGPRADRPEEAGRVAAVREIIAGVDWPCTVQKLYRDQNMGLRHGVYGAISWFFEQEEYGIILEDDCVPDRSFFQFCTELLEYYREDESVYHISGSNLAEYLSVNYQKSYFFSKFPFVWGWAGWRRSWNQLSIDLDGLDTFFASGVIEQWLPDRAAQVYLKDKFQQTRAGKINSWAYAWFYSILRSDGFCIIPRYNLVQNVGVGTSEATNTKGYDPTKILRSRQMTFPLLHPDNKQIDRDRALVLFHASQKRPFRLRLWYFLYRIGLR